MSIEDDNVHPIEAMAREGDSTPLHDASLTEDIGARHTEMYKLVSGLGSTRIQIKNEATDRLGLHIQAPERATNFPVILSCMLDYTSHAVFIFSNSFGASECPSADTGS
jgi:hypothetical protein